MSDRVEVAGKSRGRIVRSVPSVLRHAAGSTSRIFVEESGVAWISRGDQLFRYDPHIVKDYDIPYSAFVRGVADLRTDSTVFGGSFLNEAGGFTGLQPANSIPQLEYELNNLRFKYAAPTYNSPTETVFQYQLVGHDKEWSPWTGKISVSYSGLREGDYEFRVRAKNGFDILSEVGSYSFQLLPPWYRTWWAYSLYLIAGLTFVTMSWKYVAMVKAQRQAAEQARELARERVINEKLNEANDQLQVANTRLQEAITLKDEFLATTSHELRTPITAILGYASILREEIPSDYHEFVDIIDKSGQRLMTTLNSLLDLAKLRAGTMEVNIERVDVDGLLSETVAKHELVAQTKGIEIEYRWDGNSDPVIRSDDHLVRKVVENLIDNAIKFTEEGSVQVLLSVETDILSIDVADTGVGVDEEFLPALFDEFRQESGGLSRTHAGNGLGLAIVSKMVDLLRGSTDVQSRKGHGSTFTVRLPRDFDRSEQKLRQKPTRLEPDRGPARGVAMSGGQRGHTDPSAHPESS